MHSIQSLTALFCQNILDDPAEASHITLNLPLKSVSAQFHDEFENSVEAATPTGRLTASTLKGSIKTWSTLDATAKLVRKLGIGNTTLDIAKWQPSQRQLSI